MSSPFCWYDILTKKYNEISTIRSYIEQGEDAYYWKWILDEKNSELLQLVNYRTQIKTAIDKFEWALFDKYYNLLQRPMQTYYSDLEVQYYTLAITAPSNRTFNFFDRNCYIFVFKTTICFIFKISKSLTR